MDLGELSLLISSLRRKAGECVTNSERLAVFAECELLGVAVDRQKVKYNDDARLKNLKDDISQISSSLALRYVSRPVSHVMKILHKIDEVSRLLAVWLALMLASVFLAIPCILLTAVDFILVRCGIISVYMQISVQCKLFIAHTILRLSGIYVVIEGLQQESFGKACAMACFSHASSMDAFLLASAIPVTALTVVSFFQSIQCITLPTCTNRCTDVSPLIKVQERAVSDTFLLLVRRGLWWSAY